MKKMAWLGILLFLFGGDYGQNVRLQRFAGYSIVVNNSRNNVR